MILSIYVYKGAFNSLVGPWVVCSYLNKKMEDHELEVVQENNIFKQRKSLDRYNHLLKNNINIITLNSFDINTEGEYAVYKAIKKLQAFAKAQSIYYRKPLQINKIVSATTWDERLTIMYAVFVRHQYLKRYSTPHLNLLKMENNLDIHMSIINNYKYLPPIYLLQPCLEHFKHVYPKPMWWKIEIEHILNI